MPLPCFVNIILYALFSFVWVTDLSFLYDANKLIFVYATVCWWICQSCLIDTQIVFIAFLIFEAQNTAECQRTIFILSLLLDEHTAALDPKTAAKVLETTEKIVNRDKLTTLMITHNMKDAIAIGNRLIMMNEGKIIYDVSGEEKKKLTTKDLLDKFKVTSGEEFDNDRVLLSTEAGE